MPIKIAHKYDKDGFYLEDVVLRYEEKEIELEEELEEGQEPRLAELVEPELPENCTFVPMPEPIYKPKFVDGEWIDTITEEELKALEPKPTLIPSDKDRIAQLEAVVNSLLLGGL